MNPALLKIKRLQTILYEVGKGNYPTTSNLLDKLGMENDSSSERTLNRDMKALREDYLIDIDYDKGRKGYTLENANTEEVDLFYHMSNTLLLSHQMLDAVREGKLMSEHIISKSPKIKFGENVLSRIYEAVVNRREVVISDYFSTYSGKSSSYEGHPYRLIEYLNRWYVYLWVPSKNDFRSLSIERIEKLDVKPTTFERTQALPKELFEVVGLNYSESSKKELVKFRVRKHTAGYIENQPIHSSQNVYQEDDKWVYFQIAVRPNYELKQLFKMHEGNLEVL
ncbi:helix-turn-helix transcriptional regulator [Phaeocystidibacter luteus]|uniref:WYL domain-containing protein n=1 Tax=Phaeocystidibacter luteus TaxID=911197 RepID=A0A6N6RFS7_9FLAO|nr:WYL domain-containing protein [Phaeocystidibacter luteus]KAB2810015.1 WYL domain-containing protein [Phaeocystidibacter luteus]